MTVIISIANCALLHVVINAIFSVCKSIFYFQKVIGFKAK